MATLHVPLVDGAYVVTAQDSDPGAVFEEKVGLDGLSCSDFPGTTVIRPIKRDAFEVLVTSTHLDDRNDLGRAMEEVRNGRWESVVRTQVLVRSRLEIRTLDRQYIASITDAGGYFGVLVAARLLDEFEIQSLLTWPDVLRSR